MANNSDNDTPRTQSRHVDCVTSFKMTASNYGIGQMWLSCRNLMYQRSAKLRREPIEAMAEK
jgi:hypothetical protein